MKQVPPLAVLMNEQEKHFKFVYDLLSTDQIIEISEIRDSDLLFISAGNGRSLIFSVFGSINFINIYVYLENINNDEVAHENQNDGIKITDSDAFRIKIGEYLIKKGVDIDFRDRDGNTPLICSILKDDLIGVRFLLQNGANVFLKNNEGKSAYDYAQLSTNEQIKLEIEPYLK